LKLDVTIVGNIRRKPVFTYASTVCGIAVFGEFGEILSIAMSRYFSDRRITGVWVHSETSGEIQPLTAVIFVALIRHHNDEACPLARSVYRN